jgi:protein disulfide-isomerase
MKMKTSGLKQIVLLCLSLFWIGGMSAGQVAWHENYAEALQLAKAQDKKVLVDFTGSDWCGWCIKLDGEIFSKEAFIEYAEENLILVKLDFPRKKEQSDDIKSQNQKLMGEYGVRGFPTIVVLNAGGHEIGRLGYMRGGPDGFVKVVKEL